MSNSAYAIFIQEITVTDPISHLPVEVEIWKDPVSGGTFGLDSSFVDQVEESIRSPFNHETILYLEMPE